MTKNKFVKTRILDLMADKKPRTHQDIKAALPDVLEQTVTSTVCVLAADGALVKRGRGLFKIRENADEKDEVYSSQDARILDLFKHADKPTHMKRLAELAETLDEPINYNSLRGVVLRLVNEGRIVRLSRGLYALSENTK